MIVIPIQNDNGFEECLSCVNSESNICLRCNDAELYEDDGSESELLAEKELEFA